jgi:hypothetical protein
MGTANKETEADYCVTIQLLCTCLGIIRIISTK